jgi:hypothetical protein
MQKSNLSPHSYNGKINYNIFDEDSELSSNARLFTIVIENLMGDADYYLLDYEYLSKLMNVSKNVIYQCINEFIINNVYGKCKVVINGKTYTYLINDYYFFQQKIQPIEFLTKYTINKDNYVI